jgi:hypothetical protein
MFARFCDALHQRGAKNSLCVLPFLFATLFSLGSKATAEGYITFPSDIEWVTRRSEHFEIVYRAGQTQFAERALLAAEKAHQLIAPIFPEIPESTYIVLADFKDGLNGYAVDFPYPHMVIFASPPEGSSTLAVLDDWLESVILHEYVHVLHLYPATGLWKVGRRIFGSWVLPNGLMPSHLHEGLATFLETQLGEGGRGQGADFHMYRRIAVKEGKWGNEFAPLDLLEGSVLDWPHGHSPYFFGYWAWKEVWDRKKQTGILNVVKDQSGNWPYWISRPFNKELGISYPQLWSQIYERGKKEALGEIAEAEAEGLTPQKQLTDSGHSKWDLAAGPDGNLMAMRTSHPDDGARVEIRRTDTVELVDTFEPESGSEQGICFGTWNGTQQILYTDSRNRHGYQTFVLRRRSVEAKDTRDVVIVDKENKAGHLEHLHAVSCAPDFSTLAAYVETAGHGQLLRLQPVASPSPDFPEFKVTEEWNIPKATWISGVLAGKTIYAIVRGKGGSTLYSWAGANAQAVGHISKTHFHTLMLDPHAKVLTIGGESGRNELWELDLQTARITKRVAVLGGLSGAAFTKEKLFALGYRHGGYDLFEMNVGETKTAPSSTKRKKPVPVKIDRSPMESTSAAESKSFDATQVLLQPEESYSPWASLTPRAWIPNILIVPDGMQISAWIPGFDIGQKNSYSLFGGYDTRGSPFFSGSYAYRFHQQSIAQAEAYYSPSYLISNRSFLNTWGGSVGLSSAFGFIDSFADPRFGINLQYRRVESSRFGPAKNSAGVGISLTQAFGFKARPRAISPHRGTRVSVAASQFPQSLGSTESYHTITASIDQYVSSPWLGSHLFFLTAHFGYTAGTVLYNSFFQGGGELIFSQGRGFFLNRGFFPGSFLGRRMLSMNTEYRFPMWDVYRGHGLWPAFLQRIHGAVIADLLTFDNGTSSTAPRDFFKVFYGSVGVELKSDWKWFYYLPASVRVGFYRGLGSNQFWGIQGEPLYVTFAIEGGLF